MLKAFLDKYCYLSSYAIKTLTFLLHSDRCSAVAAHRQVSRRYLPPLGNPATLFLKNKGLSMDRNLSSLSLKPKVASWQFLSSFD